MSSAEATVSMLIISTTTKPQNDDEKMASEKHSNECFYWNYIMRFREIAAERNDDYNNNSKNNKRNGNVRNIPKIIRCIVFANALCTGNCNRPITFSVITSVPYRLHTFTRTHNSFSRLSLVCDRAVFFCSHSIPPLQCLLDVQRHALSFCWPLVPNEAIDIERHLILLN